MLANGGELDGKRLLSPRAVELMSSNHVGEMFAGQLGRPKGMGFGLTVEVVVDPSARARSAPKGSFGWDGAFGTHFWVDPKETARRPSSWSRHRPGRSSPASSGTSRRP